MNQCRKFVSVAVAATVVVLSAGSPVVHAATNEWVAGSSATWFDPSNWTPGLPTSSDDALIRSNTTAKIEGATTATASNLYVNTGGVSIGDVVAGTLAVVGEIKLSGGNLVLNYGTLTFNTLTVGGGSTYTDTTFGSLILTGATPTIQMANGVTVTINSDISGTEGLTKSGLGTLILAGDNTYSGGTVINTGTLQVGSGGTTGSLGAGDVTNNATLVFNRSNSIIVTNFITGTGSLRKSGSGALTLIADNDYTGGTVISAGALQVGDGGTTGSLGSGIVSNNATLIFNRSDDFTVGNLIAGSGTLTQSGSGTLTLTNNNTYTGRTIISNGVLQVGDGGTTGSLGTGVVSNNSSLVFNRSDSIILSNTVTGVGSLTHAGGGTLTLVGNSSYSGQTVISAGTLQVGNGGTTGMLGTGEVSNAGALIFSRTNDIIVVNVISGTGAVTHAGAGNLALTAANTYSGGTWVNNGGTLAVMNNSALGAGDMNLISGTLQADLTPSNSVINIGGNYTQGSNGILQIVVGGAVTGLFDQVNIAGDATLDGTLRLVDEGGYQPHHGDELVILMAGGTITGTFATVDNQLVFSPLLSLQTNYTASEVTLTWEQLSFVPYASTPNQMAVAAALDSIATSTVASDVALVDFLDYLPAGTNGLPAAFDLIAPEELASMFTVAFAGMDAQGYQFLKRANELRAGYHQLYAGILDPASPEASDATLDKRWGLYAEVSGQMADVQGDANAGSYDQTGYGVTVGVDRRIGENIAFGAAVGYAKADASLAGNGEVNADRAYAQLYGVWFRQGVHVEAMIGGGLDTFDTRRQGLDGIAEGSADGMEWHALLAGGYDWQEGGWRFGPVAMAQYMSARIDGISETGSMAPLQIDAQNADTFYTQLGAHLLYRHYIEGTWTFVTPEVYIAWRHDFIEDPVEITSRFVSGSGNAFTVTGPQLGQDSIVGGLGITLQLKPGFSAYLNYCGQLGRSGYDAHAVNAGARIGF